MFSSIKFNAFSFPKRIKIIFYPYICFLSLKHHDITVLERKRKRLVHAIMNDTNMKRMSQIEKLYFDESPLCYSVEELQEKVQEFENEYISGKFVSIPHEEIMKEYGL